MTIVGGRGRLKRLGELLATLLSMAEDGFVEWKYLQTPGPCAKFLQAAPAQQGTQKVAGAAGSTEATIGATAKD